MDPADSYCIPYSFLQYKPLIGVNFNSSSDRDAGQLNLPKVQSTYLLWGRVVSIEYSLLTIHTHTKGCVFVYVCSCSCVFVLYVCVCGCLSESVSVFLGV